MSRTSATEEMVGLSSAHFAYKDQEVLTGVTMAIHPGEIVGLLGPSGSGKTTLLQLIGGLHRPTSGTVRRSIDAGSIRWVFQLPTALWRRSIAENVAIGLHDAEVRPTQVATKVAWVLEAVGLSETTNRLAKTLSGGELQRLQIARSLASEPLLVLADEPTGQLDRAATESVVKALQAVRQMRSAVVVATHDPDLAAVCDRRFEVRDGLATLGDV